MMTLASLSVHASYLCHVQQSTVVELRDHLRVKWQWKLVEMNGINLFIQAFCKIQGVVDD
jgi:hypothetical protein